ncbi:hypothetical protein D3C75_716830 [compost metagenome]
MNAETAPLAQQAVEDRLHFGEMMTIPGEQTLKFVDNHQQTRHGRRGHPTIAFKVRDTQRLETLTAAGDLIVQVPQHTQTIFSAGLSRHQCGVRQRRIGVNTELDTFLVIEQE